MNKYLEKIKYSEFYKENLQKTQLVQGLLSIRDKLRLATEPKGLELKTQLERDAQLFDSITDKKWYLYITNDWGGGSESYLKQQQEKATESNQEIIVLRYRKNKKRYEIEGFYEKQPVYLEDISELKELGNWLHIEEIYINQFVLFPNIVQVLEEVLLAKERFDAKLVMLVHDYFAVCPSFTMTNREGKFCRDAIGVPCQECYKEWNFQKTYAVDSIRDWRSHWGHFLEACDEVRCFSEDTQKRMRKFYGDHLAYTCIPHAVTYLEPVTRGNKTTKYLNIGILGVLNKQKGGRVVQKMLQEIQDRNLAIRIILLGFADGIKLKESEHFICTGRYQPTDLPRLIQENDIDVFFIASIWPETFSYTTEEVMKMNMPIVTFDLGAPADRVAGYEKGMILDLAMEPAEILKRISSWKTLDRR